MKLNFERKKTSSNTMDRLFGIKRINKKIKKNIKVLYEIF